jgi:hypothetical protein
MDPYLEAQGRWPGFHNLLIAHCSELLNRDLPETYVAQTDERVAEVRETWIEIYHLPEIELVTAIEILSPSNKGGSGRVDYQTKRDALIDQPVNLIEIDLLLSGSRMPVSGRLQPGEYVAIVARSGRRLETDVYTWPLRQVLPILPIPLRPPDPDVSLDLGEAFRMTYDRGGYARVMRHGRPLPESLPISPEDRAWAESLTR